MNPRPATSKLVVWVTLEDALRDARQPGGTRRIVLANGAFDLLHVGHVRYLEGARLAGDLLVVGINSDESVRRTKGALRPIVPQAERAELVCALECVDLAILFDEPTAERLIRVVRPHMHAKGTDYSPETVPEAQAVAAVGGRVIITGDAKEHSTTEIIGRLRL